MAEGLNSDPSEEEKKVYNRFAEDADLGWVPAFIAREVVANKVVLLKKRSKIALDIMRNITQEALQAIREKRNPLADSTIGPDQDSEVLTRHLRVVASVRGAEPKDRSKLYQQAQHISAGFPIERALLVMQNIVEEVAAVGPPVSSRSRR